MHLTARTTRLALPLLALPLGTAEAQTLSAVDRQKMIENIVQADQNNDGAISRAEFEALIDLNAADSLGRAGQVKRLGAHDAAFGRLDADGNGLLTREEMQALAEQ